MNKYAYEAISVREESKASTVIVNMRLLGGGYTLSTIWRNLMARL